MLTINFVLTCRQGSRVEVVSAPLDSIPMHMSGGSIIPMHHFETKLAMTTAEVRRSPLTLVVALQHPITEMGATGSEIDAQEAHGVLYFDDGESLQVGKSHCNFLRLSFKGELLSSGQHAAELEVSFGAPTSFKIAADNSSGYDCEGFEWPELVGVKVLGWQIPIEAAITMEIFVSQKMSEASGQDILENYRAQNLDQVSFGIYNSSLLLNMGSGGCRDCIFIVMGSGGCRDCILSPVKTKNKKKMTFSFLQIEVGRNLNIGIHDVGRNLVYPETTRFKWVSARSAVAKLAASVEVAES